MMNKYSDFFATVYDETKPVAKLGMGTHYSILRSIHWIPIPTFHDIAVIWDEDHDPRIIWVLEQLLVNKHLDDNTIAIGERKGHVTLVTRTEPSAELEKAVESISGSVPNDAFSSDVSSLDGDLAIINDNTARVRAYLAGIDALWELGHKVVTFNTSPF